MNYNCDNRFELFSVLVSIICLYNNLVCFTSMLIASNNLFITCKMRNFISRSSFISILVDNKHEVLIVCPYECFY